MAPGEDEAELKVLILKIIDACARRKQILSCNFLDVYPQWRLLVGAG
ncbi:Hypothetical protein PMT_2291 [Prochlorococcus marinus str. MIT 9313]|uniref:Uncharacterized protein n=1 Tax=Prochlorococcus marinus (strain MIT 9313) TaxID=74547 RepID=B9ERC9_PROMM|nr:Hypothetical protein PMT_2291 [Prochlorococcus marinus str. MIT 9313]